MIAGVSLMISGMIAFALRRTLTKKFKVSMTLVSILSIGSCVGGFYLFLDGIDDLAIGQVGAYHLKGPRVQTLAYPDKDAFEKGLVLTQKSQPHLRRLHFQCPDGSQEFTVYLTGAGAFGIPARSVTCHDGFELVSYAKGGR